MTRLHSSSEQSPASTHEAAGTQTPRDLPPILDSQAVLQGRSSVTIEHNGAVYRLQTTRQGKLILTK
jgi:hemin uptake protein HemP